MITKSLVSFKWKKKGGEETIQIDSTMEEETMSTKLILGEETMSTESVMGEEIISAKLVLGEETKDKDEALMQLRSLVVGKLTFYNE